MRLRLSSLVERVRSSLFFVPMVAVVVAIVAGLASVGLDSRLDSGSARLPLGLASTVESARTLLSTIAGATITFAGIAFSVSLLLIQQASSQHSPRVVHTLFRDPFNRRVMGLVLGTFTYCLIVLRSVRSAIEPNGEAVVPNLSVGVAVLLGIATILAVVAFIDHSAHSMDISEILENVRRESIRQIRHEWQVAAATEPDPLTVFPPEDGWVVRFDRDGWIQQIDRDALLETTPPGATLWLAAFPGRYAIEGAPLGRLSTCPTEPDVTERALNAAIGAGDTRTMQQDVSYGLRQLADVALKALSPGINDPTTAQDAILHSTAVLAEILRRDPPAGTLEGEDGRVVVLTQQPTHDDLVRLAYDEVRRAAAEQPAVSVYLLDSLAVLTELTRATASLERSRPLVEQARLVVAGCRASRMLPTDLLQVERTFARCFVDVEA